MLRLKGEPCSRTIEVIPVLLMGNGLHRTFRSTHWWAVGLRCNGSRNWSNIVLDPHKIDVCRPHLANPCAWGYWALLGVLSWCSSTTIRISIEPSSLLGWFFHRKGILCCILDSGRKLLGWWQGLCFVCQNSIGSLRQVIEKISRCTRERLWGSSKKA